eukprot:CAMPEP_0117545416 /NCGR_PEP_ID=MMETSP0784-20121206/46082_1 /TAXON_ID=39447 /ORGANISM="" /LENGTH=138 /DNA_ID=CAMNT_0005342259 /DNA_START=201 /DNA_END=614 /DNA_ORIENTATION=+
MAGQRPLPATVLSCPTSGCDGESFGGSCTSPDNEWWSLCKFGTGACQGTKTLGSSVTCTLTPTPTHVPTALPSLGPSAAPTPVPTLVPSQAPSAAATLTPSPSVVTTLTPTPIASPVPTSTPSAPTGAIAGRKTANKA